jgi:hypothetical protein
VTLLQQKLDTSKPCKGNKQCDKNDPADVSILECYDCCCIDGSIQTYYTAFLDSKTIASLSSYYNGYKEGSMPAHYDGYKGISIPGCYNGYIHGCRPPYYNSYVQVSMPARINGYSGSFMHAYRYGCMASSIPSVIILY